MIFVNYYKKFCQINYLGILSLCIQCLIIIYKKFCLHRFRFIILFTFTSTFFFLYIISENANKNDEQNAGLFPTNTSISTHELNLKTQSYHLILLWTDLFDNIYWHQPLYFNLSTVISCSQTYQCRFTRDKNKLSQASVVGFHLYDINRHELPDRERTKLDNQTFVFITGESPVNFYYQNPSFVPYVLDNYFDRSISYKYNSPFSVFAPIKKRRNMTLNNIQHEHEFNNNSLKLKKKSIIWIVSNCITFSQREKYVKELNKYIDIDIYGKCGRLCSEKNQCQINLNNYYFYLSFENSRCKSYITEKFWNIILNPTHRLVPIVMGPEENDYQRIAPKQSYIHVDQYKTPEDLAKHLHYLIKNPDKYLEYLQWRETTENELITSETWINFLCPLCQMAYETRLSPHRRLNFSSWYNPKTECHHDDVKLFTQCKQATLNTWMSWIHRTKCP